MDAQAIRDKIKALETLADPARTSTPEHERAAAERMLERFKKRLAEQTGTAASADDYRGYRPPVRVYGEKYADVQNLSLTEIAKLIRAEIKLARKVAKMTAKPGAVKTVDPIGDAPTQIKYSVRTEYFAGGGAINITIKNVPENWGWTREPDPHYPDEKVKTPAPALRALAQALNDIQDSYNYNGSDSRVDYFDVRFYGHVYAEGGLILAV